MIVSAPRGGVVVGVAPVDETVEGRVDLSEGACAPSWPWPMATVADQCRMSWRRHFGSIPAKLRARRHHQPIRSGLTMAEPSPNIHGPYGSRSRRTRAIRASMSASSATARTFAVFVGASRSSGRPSPRRTVSTQSRSSADRRARPSTGTRPIRLGGHPQWQPDAGPPRRRIDRGRGGQDGLDVRERHSPPWLGLGCAQARPRRDVGRCPSPTHGLRQCRAGASRGASPRC